MRVEAPMAEQNHEQEAAQTKQLQSSAETAGPTLLDRIEGFLQRIKGLENLSSSAIPKHYLNKQSSPSLKEPLARPK